MEEWARSRGKVGRMKEGRKTDVFKSLIQLHSGPLTFSVLIQ